MNAKLKNIIAMLIFGSIGIFVKYIPLPSSAVADVRAIIGVLVILIACALKKRRIDIHSIGRNIILLALSGIAMGANWICLFEAYKYTTVAIATLSYYFAPVIVVVASAILLKEKMTPVKIICTAAAVIGMILVSNVAGGGENNLKGIIFGLCAAVLYASVIMMNKFVKDINDVECTLTQLATAFIVLLPYVLLTEDVSSFKLDALAVVFVLVVGIVHTGISYLLYFSSLQQLKAQTIALFGYIDPVTAVILSAILLKEAITPLQILGAVLILGSTLFSELWSEKLRKKEVI